MRLLSVDWDYFFRMPRPIDDHECLYDWSPRETPLFIDGIIWTMRAAGFKTAGKPLPGTTGEERTFWSRFKFSASARLIVAESHCQILAGDRPDEIWNFDAHHDSYQSTAAEIQKRGNHTCGDWATYAVDCGITVKTMYPAWRASNRDSKPIDKRVKVALDPGTPVNRVFGGVFVARSGAWTPPWLDDKFEKFIDACPVLYKRVDILKRVYHVAEADQIAKMTSEQFFAMAAHGPHGEGEQNVRQSNT